MTWKRGVIGTKKKLTYQRGHGAMRDRRCEEHQNPIAGDVYIIGIDDPELLERQGMLGIADRSK